MPLSYRFSLTVMASLVHGNHPLRCKKKWLFMNEGFVQIWWKSLRCVRFFVTLWTIQSMEFSRPEYWSGLPFPPPGYWTCVSRVAGGFLTSWATREARGTLGLLSRCPALCSVTWLCPTLWDPMGCSPPGSSVHGDSLGQNTRVGSLSFLQGIFPTQELNWDLLHCRWILYSLSQQGSPNIIKSPRCPLDFVVA